MLALIPSGYFLSQLGAYAVLLVVAAKVHGVAHSDVAAGMVFVLAYLPAFLLGTRFGRLLDRFASRTLLISMVTLQSLLGFVAYLMARDLRGEWVSVVLLALVLGARSVTTLAERSLCLKWIKARCSSSREVFWIRTFFFAFFCSALCSGFWIRADLPVPVLLVVGGFSSILCFLGPGPFRAQPEARGPSGSWEKLWRDSELRKSFISLAASQTLFQGAGSVWVTHLPLRAFDLGSRGVGMFQIALSAGIVAGFLGIVLFGPIGSKWVRHVFILGSAVMLTIGMGQSLGWTLGVVFVTHALYEFAWLSSTTHFLVRCSQNEVGNLQFVSSALATLSMAISVVIYASLITGVGLEIATVCLVVAVNAFAIFLSGGKQPGPRMTS